MVRTQTTNGSTTSPRQFGFFFNGVRVGEIGNNGTDNVDYATTIAANGTVGGSGPFRGGASGGTAFADFDANYAAINTSAAAEAGAEARYTVRPGDTLASIAQTLWGDASLWYMLAEANGLSASSSLTAGQSLIAPAKVTNLHNNSQTFKPYDAGKAIGDVQPGAPVPPPAKSGGCGALGAILLIIIAVAVTVVSAGAAVAALGPAGTTLGAGITAAFGGAAVAGVGAGALVGIGAASAALGSIVSQGIGVATGLQDKFSWKGVALSALAGGIGGGIGGASLLGKSAGVFLNGVARGVVSNVAVQGIATATGLQDKFDWTGVAVAGVVSGVGGAVGRGLAKAGLGGAGATQLSKAGNSLVSGAAGAIAGAATRSLITGTDFGDNVLATLPDVVGATIGNLVAGGVAGKGAPRVGKDLAKKADGTTNSKAILLGASPSRLASLVYASTVRPPSNIQYGDGGEATILDRITRAIDFDGNGKAGIGDVKALFGTVIDKASAASDEILVTARRTASDLYNSAANGLDTLSQRISMRLTNLGDGRSAPVYTAGYGSAGSLGNGRAQAEIANANLGRQLGAAYSDWSGKSMGFQVPRGFDRIMADSITYAQPDGIIKSMVGLTNAAIKNPQSVFGMRDFTRGDGAGLTLMAAPGAGRVVSRATTLTIERGIPLVGRALADTRGALTIGRFGGRGGSRSISLIERVETPNPVTGAGYGVNNPPVRVAGDWSRSDIYNGLYGRSPRGLGGPHLHHADQMPGAGIHEILPNNHLGNSALHPNAWNQGVTRSMRTQDANLHWWYRAREQGADAMFPNQIYD